MKDSQRDTEPRGQIAEEELPDRGLRLQQLVDKFGIEQDVQCLEILPLFQKTVRRTLPQGIQHLLHGCTCLRQQFDELLASGIGQRLHLKADLPAVCKELPHRLVADIQDVGSKVPGGKRGIVEEDLILPDIQCQIQKMIVLLDPQRHGLGLLSHIRFRAVLRYSHFIKIRRIIK